MFLWLYMQCTLCMTINVIIMIQECQLYTHTCIQRFLQQTGGTRGGWDEYDHNTFQHIRSKYPVSSKITVKDLCVYMHMEIILSKVSDFIHVTCFVF